MDAVPEREPQQQRKPGYKHNEDGNQPEGGEMQAKDQMLAKELFLAPLQKRQQHGISRTMTNTSERACTSTR